MEWKGDRTESAALTAAINRQCLDARCGGDHCTYGSNGQRLTTCAAHQMLLTDQTAMNGLLFHRRFRDRLLAAEGLREYGASSDD
jgi:hypothetical protein